MPDYFCLRSRIPATRGQEGQAGRPPEAPGGQQGHAHRRHLKITRADHPPGRRRRRLPLDVQLADQPHDVFAAQRHQPRAFALNSCEERRSEIEREREEHIERGERERERV